MPEEFEQHQEDRPGQHQPRQPGFESEMAPKPVTVPEHYRGAGKLQGRVALVTGGDSGIGRAVSVLFAREGADVAVGYLDEDDDAAETARLVEAEGRRCVALPGDLREEEHCRQSVQRAVDELGRLDVLVNHAGEQHPRDSIEQVSAHQLERTFQLNVFAMFHLVKAALAHLGEGAAIVNTASVTAYQGNPSLIDYTAANGAIVAFTRALSNQLIERRIRVNAVAPGPVWTPLIPATFPAGEVEDFGAQTPLGRIGQPAEIAPSYVFLACEDSSFMSGQVLHPNGGSIIGS